MGRKILLIEDEPNIVEAICFILKRDGFIVSHHADGTTALAAIERHNPDVIILDVMLPGRSGFDILQDLRHKRSDLVPPVLMLTARGQTKDRELAAQYGVNTFMTKPFSNSEILDAVRALSEL